MRILRLCKCGASYKYVEVIWDFEDKMISTNKELTELIRDMGHECGMEICATFEEHKEFKTTWNKFGGIISLKVTDYLRNGPDDAIKDYLACIMDAVRKLPKRDYSFAFKQYIQSSAFLRQNQPIYIARSRNLTNTGKGKTYDLDAMYCKLITRGMVEDVPNVQISWSKRPNFTRVGYTSPIMNTVCISSIMDRPDVPEFVPEYVLYHELLHHEQPLSRTTRHHDAWFRMREAEYPKSEEAERILQKLGREGRIAKKVSSY